MTQTPHAGAESNKWSADRAHRWYNAQRWPVGANYYPSNAINQLEMFQPASFDPRRIDQELGWASSYGLNTIRVFLHDLLWAQDARGFQLRLAQFVGIAARHGIKPLFVFFDSCWNPYPRPGKQPAPRPGLHNSGWVQSPGAERLGDRNYAKLLHTYVQGIMTQFRNDDRVLGWDLWNEPDNPADMYPTQANKLDLVAELLPQVFDWARAVDASQPLTSAVWQGTWADPARRSTIADIQLTNSDVITFHSYAEPAEFENRLGQLTGFGRPIMCTEYLARTLGNTVENILPIAKRHNIGAINWGLVAGKAQTYFPYDSWKHPYKQVPKVWFHDLLWANGQPYSASEMQLFRKLTAEKPS